MDNNKLLMNRISDYVDLAQNKDIPIYSNFLDPKAQSIAMDVLKYAKGIEYSFFGGNDFCERRIVAIKSTFCNIRFDENEICAIKLSFDKFSNKWNVHSNILGSVLGLGYDRKMIGDIVISNEYTSYIYVLKSASEHIEENLISVGRASVSVSIVSLCDVELDENIGQVKQKTVPSLRLDAVLCAALNLSRSKALEYIKAEAVYVNFRLINKTDYTLKQGDIVSVRKKGRFIVEDVGGKSAKNRTWVELRCFLK